MVRAQRCGLTTVAVPLASVVGCSARPPRAHRRAWDRDAAPTSGATRGRQRRSLEVTGCLAPRRCWGVAWRDPPCRPLALALAASTLGQRGTLLSRRGVGRGG